MQPLPARPAGERGTPPALLGPPSLLPIFHPQAATVLSRRVNTEVVVTQLPKPGLSLFVSQMWRRGYGLWAREGRTSFLKEHEGSSQAKGREELAGQQVQAEQRLEWRPVRCGWETVQGLLRLAHGVFKGVNRRAWRGRGKVSQHLQCRLMVRQWGPLKASRQGRMMEWLSV